MFPGHYHCPLYYAFFLRFSFYFLWLLFLTFPFLSQSALIVICIPIAQQVRGKKKLTITLFTVIIGSLTAYFPLTIQLGVFMFHPQFANDIIWRLSLRIGRTAVVLFVVTSLINPIIYAMQVPEQGEMSWKSTSAELQTVQSRAIYHYVSSVSITIL